MAKKQTKTNQEAVEATVDNNSIGEAAEVAPMAIPEDAILVKEVAPTDMTYYANYNVTNYQNILELPELDTRKTTLMRFSFWGCALAKKAPEYDSSKVTDFTECYSGCESLKEIGVIDLSSAECVDRMFLNCPVTGIKLKNVPKALSLKYIGTEHYEVLNYKD